MTSIRIGAFLTLAACIFSVAAAADTATAPRDQRVYFFANSLVNHKSDSDETTVPHWLHHLALAGKRKFAANGQWGLLRNFIKDLPPTDNWSFKDVPKAWHPSQSEFKDANFSAVISNPGNFIQYKSVDTPYPDEADNLSPLSATLQLFDWVSAQDPDVEFYIYEGWSNSDRQSKSFPLSKSAMSSYQAFNRGEYHEWYLDYVEKIRSSRPSIKVELIPVASVLAKVYTETPLKALDPREIYSDLSPHGTNTTYFLAALVTYTKIYRALPPEDFIVPPTLPELVRNNYRDIIRLICADVLEKSECQ